MRVRFEFSKDKEARYVSHLDMIRVFERSLRRAGLPLSYSQGFNPHPKMAFSPALALGTSSEREYVDISFETRVNISEAKIKLQESLPSGFNIRSCAVIPEGAQSLNSLINRAVYTIKCLLAREVSQAELDAWCSALMEMEKILIKKKTKKGFRERDIRRGIFSLNCKPVNDYALINADLLLSSEGSVRPEDVVEVLVSLGMPVESGYMEVRRTGLYRCQGETCLNPMQVLSQVC